MPTDDAAARVAQIRARFASPHLPSTYRMRLDIEWLLTALAAAEQRLAELEPAYQDAASTQTRILLDADRHEQEVRNLTERAQFALERADAAEVERDKYKALYDGVCQQYDATLAAEAAAEQRATRLAALEVTARAWVQTDPLTPERQRAQHVLEATVAVVMGEVPIVPIEPA